MGASQWIEEESLDGGGEVLGFCRWWNDVFKIRIGKKFVGRLATLGVSITRFCYVLLQSDWILIVWWLNRTVWKLSASTFIFLRLGGMNELSCSFCDVRCTSWESEDLGEFLGQDGKSSRNKNETTKREYNTDKAAFCILLESCSTAARHVTSQNRFHLPRVARSACIFHESVFGPNIQISLDLLLRHENFRIFLSRFQRLSRQLFIACFFTAHHSIHLGIVLYLSNVKGTAVSQRDSFVLFIFGLADRYPTWLTCILRKNFRTLGITSKMHNLCTVSGSMHRSIIRQGLDGLWLNFESPQALIINEHGILLGVSEIMCWFQWHGFYE